MSNQPNHSQWQMINIAVCVVTLFANTMLHVAAKLVLAIKLRTIRPLKHILTTVSKLGCSRCDSHVTLAQGPVGVAHPLIPLLTHSYVATGQWLCRALLHMTHLSCPSSHRQNTLPSPSVRARERQDQNSRRGPLQIPAQRRHKKELRLARS